VEVFSRWRTSFRLDSNENILSHECSHAIHGYDPDLFARIDEVFTPSEFRDVRYDKRNPSEKKPPP